jgi:hypothetical protein
MTTTDKFDIFESKVYTEIPEKLLNLLITKFPEDKAIMGIYLYTQKTTYNEIWITFLHEFGETDAIKLMITLREDIDRILFDILKPTYDYTMHKTVTDWIHEQSDITSKCEDLHPRGIVIALNSYIADDTCQEICEIKNGRRVLPKSINMI